MGMLKIDSPKFQTCEMLALRATQALVLAVAAVSCAAQSTSCAEEKLLQALARLGRAGSEALCDANVLQKELGIRIGGMREFHQEAPAVDAQWTEDVTSAPGFPAIRHGRFDRRRSGQASGCQLLLEYEQFELCDEPPGRFERILEAASSRGPAQPHGSAYGFEYRFTSKGGGRTVLQLGTSTSSCTSRLRISAGGEWK